VKKPRKKTRRGLPLDRAPKSKTPRKKIRRGPSAGHAPNRGADVLPNLKKKYQLRLPSQASNLEIVREFVSRIARKVGFSEDDVNKIELAVDEACTNVIKHAYGNDNKKPMDIAIKVDLEKLTVLITDRGKGFNPRKLTHPDMKEYLAKMRVGGLGVYLMKTLMDEVEYDIQPGKRNQLRMVKYYSKDGEKTQMQVNAGA
jgi:serine/threonine-protein kinase RsbW